MDLKLKDKVVAITGGTTGIGLACALQFLKEGCRVAVCSRSEKRMNEFKEKCRENGFEGVLCLQCDVSQPDELKKFIDSVFEHFGRIDIWYNNAGIGNRKPLLDMSLEEWDEVLNLNLRAVFVGSCYVVKYLEKQGGVIVNASSFDMRIPLAGNGPYTTSKWGVEALTRIMAAEFAPYNIRVFSIAPSMIETDLTRQRVEERRDFFANQTVLGRVGKPEDIASVVAMLCSEQAGYITGTTIEISGGKYCVQNPQYGWETKKIL